MIKSFEQFNEAKEYAGQKKVGRDIEKKLRREQGRDYTKKKKQDNFTISC